MALTIDYESNQAIDTRKSEDSNLSHVPLDTKDSYGRVRTIRGYYKNETGGTIAVSKVISLCKLPNACRILPQSKCYFTAFGSSATLDLGWQNYTKDDGTAVDADVDGIAADIDVENAGSYEFATSNKQGLTFDGPALLVAGTAGAVMPANAEISLELLIAVD